MSSAPAIQHSLELDILPFLDVAHVVVALVEAHGSGLSLKPYVLGARLELRKIGLRVEHRDTAVG